MGWLPGKQEFIELAASVIFGMATCNLIGLYLVCSLYCSQSNVDLLVEHAFNIEQHFNQTEKNQKTIIVDLVVYILQCDMMIPFHSMTVTSVYFCCGILAWNIKRIPWWCFYHQNFVFCCRAAWVASRCHPATGKDGLYIETGPKMRARTSGREREWYIGMNMKRIDRQWSKLIGKWVLIRWWKQL